jgi:hypothetical protein
VAAEFEHHAAFEAGEVGAFGGGHGLVDAGAEGVDVAEPAFAGGFDGGLDGGVVAPLVAELDGEAAAGGLGVEGAEGGEVVAGGFVEVDELAGVDGLAGVGEVVFDAGFDGDELDGGIVEHLAGGEPANAVEGLVGAGLGGIGLADAGEFELGEGAEGLDLAEAVGVADAVDGDADRLRRRGGKGDGGEEVTAGEHLTEELSEPEGRAPPARTDFP